MGLCGAARIVNGVTAPPARLSPKLKPPGAGDDETKLMRMRRYMLIWSRPDGRVRRPRWQKGAVNPSSPTQNGDSRLSKMDARARAAELQAGGVRAENRA